MSLLLYHNGLPSSHHRHSTLTFMVPFHHVVVALSQWPSLFTSLSQRPSFTTSRPPFACDHHRSGSSAALSLGNGSNEGRSPLRQENDKNVVQRLGVTEHTKVMKPCSGEDVENDAVKEEELGLSLN
ncbi:non-ribosomal peptide synthetase [Sesbania bispinosa]|nr:non-ribosomal peptide synthetase [Sesbania bispinosa]